MKLFPNEEKISLLKGPQLYLTTQRIIEDRSSYASVNLEDISIIKTKFYVNSRPLVIGVIAIIFSYFLINIYGMLPLYLGGAILLAGLYYTISSRRSTLDTYAPGGSINVQVNYVSKQTIRSFIYQIEAEKERINKVEKNPSFSELG